MSALGCHSGGSRLFSMPVNLRVNFKVGRYENPHSENACHDSKHANAKDDYDAYHLRRKNHLRRDDPYWQAKKGKVNGHANTRMHPHHSCLYILRDTITRRIWRQPVVADVLALEQTEQETGNGLNKDGCDCDIHKSYEYPYGILGAASVYALPEPLLLKRRVKETYCLGSYGGGKMQVQV
jgi:hypothetical protein